MKTYVLDWETYYNSKDGYTLKKQTTEEYINDSRFHAFGFSLLCEGGNPIWVPEDKIVPVLKHIRLEENALIAHNAPFDVAILSWRYGINPKVIIDTLGMARALFGNEESLSLESLCERLGLGAKGKTILQMDGVRSPSAELYAQLGEYARQDARLAWRLYEFMRPHFPEMELRIIDISARMFTEPSFVLDRSKIERELELGETRKAELLLKANCSLDDLRSDAKFADVLISLGVEPPKKISVKKSAKAGQTVYTWAFAKSDADFKALQDHENELVQWAVEARLGLKSTIKASRAQRFLAISERMGVMPVALDYYGAGTGRYAASSSAKANMQNLPAARGQEGDDVALLRKSLVAPEGKVVVVSDLSQIEARMLVWQAGQLDVLESFAQNRDVYSEMATKIFSRHVDRKKNKDDFIAGFIGKSVVLGCLAGDTEVLTDSGWKKLLDVQLSDKLWDGIEWVSHQGIVNKGVKSLVKEHNFSATEDHEILTEHGWLEWKEVHTSRSLLKSANKLANLPSSTGLGLRKMVKEGMSLSLDVLAGMKEQCIEKILRKVKQLDVEIAGERKQTQRVKSTGDTQTLFQTTCKGRGYSTEYPASLLGVIPKGQAQQNTTQEEESRFSPSGERASRGVENFYSILFRSMDGISQNLRLTGLIITRATNRIILDLLRVVKITKIEEKFRICKTRSRTYDIAYAGPRNRFAVKTAMGAILVHNCGYGLGFLKFGGMIYSGMLGMKGILFDEAMAEQLNVDVPEFMRWIRGKEDILEKAKEMRPAMLTPIQWVVHLACAQKIINVFRLSNPRIPEYWKLAQEMIIAMHMGTEEKIGMFQTRKDALLLPNGLWMHFKQIERNESGEYSCLRRKEGRVQRVKIYGGKVVENITQALAGIVVKEAMVRMNDESGYRPILQVHDEVVVMADEDKAKATLDEINRCMTVVPDWATGLPLAAEGDFAKSYGDAK